MIGLKGLQDDISIAHSVHASKLQSDVRTQPNKVLNLKIKKKKNDTSFYLSPD